jgi:hypothetical protein
MIPLHESVSRCPPEPIRLVPVCRASLDLATLGLKVPTGLANWSME